MAAGEKCSSPYMITELEDISPILNQPLASTSRIKYTCFDVSRNLIVMGATSGGVYVFSRSPLEFVQLIPNKEGVILRVSISSDEKYISFANAKGIVTVVECSKNGSSQPSNLVSREHQGNEVTSMMWNGNPTMLYVGDDIGRVSILQIPTFITKTMFHSTTQVIMNLDSRICQIDIAHHMLLVSTMTRCYISDTEKEQYRQIGQKLRDGEYGACFVTCSEHIDRGHAIIRSQSFDRQSEVKKYQAISADDSFAVSEKFKNTLVYCGRPSSRLWEASVDGTVNRTHQYKQVLAKPPSHVVTQVSYENENVPACKNCAENDGQSLNFSRLYALKNCVIFTFKKDAIYFLNTEDVENTMWSDAFKDIADCKVYNNTIFLWHLNGRITSLSFMKIDQYLVKCFVDEKYVLCSEICLLYNDYLMSSNNLYPKIHILTTLKEKITNNDVLETITPLLEKFASKETNEATQLNSGIYIVDNNHQVKNFLHENDEKLTTDGKFLPPEAVQALKDLSNTVTDRFHSSKRKLKEKLEDLEEIMKNKSFDKPQPDFRQNSIPEKERNGEIVEKEDFFEQNKVNEQNIVYKDILNSASQVNHTVENNREEEVFKSLYRNYKLYMLKQTDKSDMCHILDDFSCDIKEIHELLLEFHEYCNSINESESESKFISSTIFLTFINAKELKDDILQVILTNPILYQAFIDACIEVNLINNKLSHLACDCGYPLPCTRTSQKPVFSELIDQFVEKQWESNTQAQCYEICKQMPYLWRKILFLRRNEDLLNILLLLLQMLDESLLYSFLPQFTMTTWNRTIQLYSILSTNVCLNCRKKFDNVNVKETLSWDALGLLLIKSVGGKSAIDVMKMHADLMEVGDLTLEFYHICLLVAKYEKYDGTIRNQLVDALHKAYEFQDARNEIYSLLQTTLNTEIKNLSLPIIVAAKSHHWGLNLSQQQENPTFTNLEDTLFNSPKNTVCLTMKDILEYVKCSMSDCILCGLQLVNEVLIRDGGLWVFKCGHVYHGACLDLVKIKLCPVCFTRDC